VAVPYRRRTIAPGATSVPVRGKALEIKADLRLRKAEHAGLKVRVGNGEETVVGYDAEAGEVYVDRTHPGESDFPGVQRAPGGPSRQGPPPRPRRLSSVEAFADRGQTVITDQVFPRPSSAGVRPFADGKGEDQVARRLAAAVQLDARWRP
jgi:sucrose-6-phosphate hydrolase SacC (GH32 family)